jgi:hypothetical protein
MADLHDELGEADHPPSVDLSCGRPAAVGKARGVRASRVWLGLWAAVVLLGSSSLMASHLAALPTPKAVDPHVVGEVARDPDARGRWTTLHILAAGCGCSRYVLEHLARRGPRQGVRERILWVASSGTSPPNAPSGFLLEAIRPSDLRERVGVVGAPTLIVADPGGRVQYVGGYTAQKQSPRIADVDVLARLERGETVEPLPVLGCALDSKTARRLDPLGLL